jgi:hypothetical protein
MRFRRGRSRQGRWMKRGGFGSVRKLLFSSFFSFPIIIHSPHFLNNSFNILFFLRFYLTQSGDSIAILSIRIFFNVGNKRKEYSLWKQQENEEFIEGKKMKKCTG